MNNLKAKLKKESGFTLIEMLIVVAIIAILIAIAIPMVNKALESAREATDNANMRAATGLAYIEYMTDSANAGKTYYYAIEKDKGSLTETKPDKGYGQGTKIGEDEVSHVDQVIELKFDEAKGEVTGEWVPKKEVPSESSSADSDT